MNNNYYTNFIILKMKKDIYNELLDSTLDKSRLKDMIDEYFQKNTIHMIAEDKKYKEEYRPRDKYEKRDNMCLARVWNCGMGGQCSRRGEYDGFCKSHSEPKTGPGKYDWWMGTIDRDRPWDPVYHTGKVHIWEY